MLREIDEWRPKQDAKSLLEVCWAQTKDHTTSFCYLLWTYIKMGEGGLEIGLKKPPPPIAKSEGELIVNLEVSRNSLRLKFETNNQILKVDWGRLFQPIGLVCVTLALESWMDSRGRGGGWWGADKRVLRAIFKAGLLLESSEKQPCGNAEEKMFKTSSLSSIVS